MSESDSECSDVDVLEEDDIEYSRIVLRVHSLAPPAAVVYFLTKPLRAALHNCIASPLLHLSQSKYSVQISDDIITSASSCLSVLVDDVCVFQSDVPLNLTDLYRSVALTSAPILSLLQQIVSATQTYLLKYNPSQMINHSMILDRETFKRRLMEHDSNEFDSDSDDSHDQARRPGVLKLFANKQMCLSLQWHCISDLNLCALRAWLLCNLSAYSHSARPLFDSSASPFDYQVPGFENVLPHDSMASRYQFACANVSGSGKLNVIELHNWANALSVTIQQKMLFEFDVSTIDGLVREVLRLQCDDDDAPDSIESAVVTPSAFAEMFQHITGPLSVDQTLLFRGFFDTHQSMSLTDLTEFQQSSAGRILLKILTNNHLAADSDSESESDVELSECVGQPIEWSWDSFHAASSMQLLRRPQWLNELCHDVCTSNAFFEAIRRGINQSV